MSLLEVDDLRAGYGRIEILHGITLRLEANSLFAIVGANGAGKTTLLMALSRLIGVRSGSIRFDGRDLTREPSHAIVRAGISHVPEGRRMLAGMTVEENLQVALALRRDLRAHAEIAYVYERFPVLGTRRAVAAGSLSGGEQQMLAIARAIVVRPKALLLDEPSMGLAPKLVGEIFGIIVDERARGTAVLLVEQNARRALAIADRACILERGVVVFEGSGEVVLASPIVSAAYLGTGDR